MKKFALITMAVLIGSSAVRGEVAHRSDEDVLDLGCFAPGGALARTGLDHLQRHLARRLLSGRLQVVPAPAVDELDRAHRAGAAAGLTEGAVGRAGG